MKSRFRSFPTVLMADVVLYTYKVTKLILLKAQ